MSADNLSLSIDVQASPDRNAALARALPSAAGVPVGLVRDYLAAVDDLWDHRFEGRANDDDLGLLYARREMELEKIRDSARAALHAAIAPSPLAASLRLALRRHNGDGDRLDPAERALLDGPEDLPALAAAVRGVSNRGADLSSAELDAMMGVEAGGLPGVALALSQLLATAENRKAYWMKRQLAEKSYEDGLDEDGVYHPIGEDAISRHSYCNGRYSEADWWLSTICAHLSAAGTGDAGREPVAASAHPVEAAPEGEDVAAVLAVWPGARSHEYGPGGLWPDGAWAILSGAGGSLVAIDRGHTAAEAWRKAAIRAKAAPPAAPVQSPAADRLRESRWIDQTRTRDTHPDVRGDCTRAAIASLFGLPLDAVPDFNADDPVAFYEGVEAFFLSRGFEMVRLDGNVALDALHLANGPAARGIPHTVVRQGSVIVHDPHPSRAGLNEVDFVVVPVPLDPSRLLPAQIYRERLQAIMDWVDLAHSASHEFADHGLGLLRGPVFDEARAALAAPSPDRGGATDGWSFDMEAAPRDGRVLRVARHRGVLGWIIGTAYWHGGGLLSGWISRGVGGPCDGLGLADPDCWAPFDPPSPPTPNGARP